MIIEVGKRYVRRDGTVTPPLVAEGDWACDPERNLVYGTLGEKLDHRVFSFEETPFDLMMEYTDV